MKTNKKKINTKSKKTNKKRKVTKKDVEIARVIWERLGNSLGIDLSNIF